MTDEEREELTWEFEALQQLLTIHQTYQSAFGMKEDEWEEYLNHVLDRMSEIRTLLENDK